MVLPKTALILNESKAVVEMTASYRAGEVALQHAASCPGKKFFVAEIIECYHLPDGGVREPVEQELPF